MGKRDLVAEIKEIRERSPYVSLSVPPRFQMLVSAFRSSPSLDSELLRYVPIGTIACVEGFYRNAIKEFIDAGSPWLDNAAALANDLPKIDFDLLRAIHGRAVTIGELISHVVRLNDLEQIGGIMSSIIGENFLGRLTTVHDRWEVEIEHKPSKPIISNAATVFADVRELFRLRHIYAHELADLDSPDHESLALKLESAFAFLNASSALATDLLHPGTPLTQAAINESIGAELDDLRLRIDTTITQITAHVDRRRHVLLTKSQKQWVKYMEAQSLFDASAFKGGTIYPAIYGHVATALAEERLKNLEEVLRRESVKL